MRDKYNELNSKRDEILLTLGSNHREEELRAIESELYEVWEQIALLEDQEMEYHQEQHRAEMEYELRAEFRREMRGF